MSLVKAKQSKIYKFSWELIGYDAAPLEVCSPRFKVSFEVTEWFIKLDLSNIQNVNYCIPFLLQRVPGIGPCEVTLDIDINVTISDHVGYSRGQSFSAKTFNEKGSLSYDIPVELTTVKSEDTNWLTSKNLLIKLEIKNIPEKSGSLSWKYWKSQATRKAVVDALKTLRPAEADPVYYDLVLKVDGKKIKLHKFILNTRWPKLASTLNISAPSDEVETKEFSGIPHDLLKNLFNFAYYGDVDFLYNLPEDAEGPDVFDVVKDYNFYRLNDQINQLSSTCESSQIFQSYRTSIEMKFTNVTSTETAMGDFRTCEIPLKPSQLPKCSEPMDAKQIEKFQQHIRFMDLRLYVEKGPLGYNWLRFSIVLGKLPVKNPVAIKCKLYVVNASEVKHLLTEQHLVFDRESGNTEVIRFSTPFSNGKESTRYRRISEPVITWEELMDERACFMQKRLVTKPSKPLRQKSSSAMKSPGTLSGADEEEEETAFSESLDGPSAKTVEENDLYFRFELKLTDGEYVYDIRHGPCIFEYENCYKVFEDLVSMREGEFTDIVLTSGNKSVDAHKAILAARSPKIKKALEKSPKDKSLSINIQPEYLQMFIDYFYTGQIQEVPYDDIEHLISVAKEYEMNCLESLLSAERTKLKIAEYKASEDGIFRTDIRADITR